MSVAAKAIDRINVAAKEGKRGLTRQQLIEALTESDMNNGVLLDAIREKEEAVLSLSRELTTRNNTIQSLESKGKEAREKIETLKAMVREADLRAAFGDGYLARVREDDAVKETFQRDVTATRVETVNPRDNERRTYSGPQSGYDHGPGRVMVDEKMSYENVAGARINGRPSTWRDKHWSQW